MTDRSDNIADLAAALVAFQAQASNPGQDRQNKFLGNSYTSLNALIDHVRPILAKHQLAVMQQVTGEGWLVGVRTTLLHASGQFVTDTVVLPLSAEKGKSTAQVAGGAITYLRRYGLAAVLGLASDPDLDGHAEPPAALRPQTQNRPAASSPPASDDSVF